MADWSPLLQHLEQATGQALQNPVLRPVSGGDINSSYRLQADGVNWFIKLNRAALKEMFAAEAAGLQELAATKTIRIPQVIQTGKFQQQAYLLLEYIELSSLSRRSASLFGQQLAQLHRLRQPWFGWHRDNTIGATPQFNSRYEKWPDFWREQRLGRQLQFAAANGANRATLNQAEKLLARSNEFFTDYQPQPALLHGDLWGGNAAADQQGNPVIFDPACYYGDREADLAMTELFGGFGQDFYVAYQDDYPLDAGYPVRKTLYNLYHILNHFNLFGGGYLGQAGSMMGRLLAELG